MRKIKIVFIIGIVFLIILPILAAEFKPYPKATLHEKATKDSQEMAARVKRHIRVTVYTTDDAFEKVYEFYKGVALEFKIPHHTPQGTTLPSGQVLKEAYFIFDMAKDLDASKLWIKVQRPAIGLTTQDLQNNTIRDVTVIIVSQK